jgi:gliding motility-associated-like protein
MKKILTLCVILLCFCLQSKADHITGGEIFYTYSSSANGSVTYNVTFKLFMRCYSNRRFNDPTIVSVFEKGTGRSVSNITVPLSSSETISLSSSDPCITNPPLVCYVVGYYYFNITLPESENGYVLASQVNFRISGINNLQNGYSNLGALYTAEIPGSLQIRNGYQNNSAKFVGSDLVVVCADNKFSYSFAAEDRDGDELRYSFCDAYRSGGSSNMVSPTLPPPFQSVPYGNRYTGSAPLGEQVSINPGTGLITGTAPGPGVYVVTVCVEEIRNGKVIARQRKDLQINIAPCKVAAALLKPEYSVCKDSKTIYLSNLSTSPLIRTQRWELTDRVGTVVYTSEEAKIAYTFADTGIYHIKLTINPGGECTDQTTSIARVYPGFEPGYEYNGICYLKPTHFTDVTKTAYGRVDSWNWSFGVDISDEPNPVRSFETMGLRNVQLIVTNTVGCRDTLIKQIQIVDKPPINLAFKDTLICKNDKVTLLAEGIGIFSWSPGIATLNANTANPTVSPSATTTYTVNLDDNGCLNSEAVLVRVTDRVNLTAMNDTTICSGDTIQLRIASDGFRYSWTPAEQLTDANVANPLAITNAPTTYTVTANIGSCTANEEIRVSTVPYPTADAGRDTVICFNTSAQLQGSSNAPAVQWFPPLKLDNAKILHPVATPNDTTTYILFAYDSRGCPKPGKDSMVVTTLPPVAAFAGRDTSIIIEQPLQLNATGGTTYLWTPDFGLSSGNIPNPVATYSQPHPSIRYKIVVSNEAGCIDSTFLNVKVFNTGPTIFVPTAFTPNADGKNDILRPLAVGIQQIDFFNIYNRYGQLIFTTNINGKGWDGTVNGVPQTTGSFVWMVKATDYTGVPYFQKGTVTLIK